MMKPTPPPALGEMIRQARERLEWRRERLGHPEFSPDYVRAVEAGKVQPSHRALEVLAGRLNLSLEELLNARRPAVDTPDLAALKEDLALQIDHARRATDRGRADEAVTILNAAEETFRPYLEQIAGYTVYRLYYGRGAAYIRDRKPAAAQRDLEHALALAQDLAVRLPERAEAVEQARNALGAAFYLQDDPKRALKHHEVCLHAIQIGVIQDLNLCVLIYSNLANDYWALNDVKQAIGIYHEALTLLNEEVSNQERLFGVWWGLSLVYKSQKDWARAYTYASRALDVCEKTRNEPAAAQVRVNLAEVLTMMQVYDEATRLLDQAEAFQKNTGDSLALSVVYQLYGLLALEQQHMPEAEEYARQSLRLSKETYQALNSGDPHTHANTIRAYARSLQVAGMVAEVQGDQTTADDCFQCAVTLLQPLIPNETGYEICRNYADLLYKRGDSERAGHYYRLARKNSRRRHDAQRAVR